MRTRAAWSACAVTFGLAASEAFETATVLEAKWSLRSWGRRLNSSGQHWLIEGSALTQETCSKSNSFTLATNLTESVLAVPLGAEGAVAICVGICLARSPI